MATHNQPRFRPWSLAALVMCAAMSGCCSWNLRGEGQATDANTCRQYRAPDKDVSIWGFSNKARDIEKNLGAQ